MPARDPSAWPSINPGLLRHSVRIQSQTSTPDAFGQPQATWTDVRVTFGGINLVSMREVVGGNQLASQVTDIWTVRHRTDIAIQPGMRILFGARVFKIQAVNNVDERNVLDHLLCLELNAPSQ